MTKPVVNSHNEWDPLEEVIVGVIDGAAIPAWHVTLRATMPDEQFGFFAANGGRPYDPELIRKARVELEGLVHVLEAEGVRVRRPEPQDFTRAYATPHWFSPGGMYAAMPRDTLLCVGDQLIEPPMPWRSRYHEVGSYRPLLKEYFRAGARWVSAPKPELKDDLYVQDFKPSKEGEPPSWVLTEVEPTFDAADFVRCGRDLFVGMSHVTNAFGLEWLRRHLGDAYRIHVLDTDDPHAMHVDTTFMPLAAGKVLVHPTRLKKMPEVLKKWEALVAPPPTTPKSHPLFMSSGWLSMNVLSLDEKRVVVERQEEPLIRALKQWGFQPIGVDFRHFYTFGGSIHCATLDVRRRGELQSYT